MNNSKYILVAFPYPSGSALHCGHAFSYGLINSYCNYLRHKGCEVFQPFGYDVFGEGTLIAANKQKRNVYDVANENINNFRNQLKRLNLSFEELLCTHEASYVKWTQWIFTKLLEHGLAYKKYGDINWCDICSNILSNEQVVDGKCERCSSNVIIKQTNQWYVKITEYKQKLIDNLEWLDYPESTKKAQRNFLENLQDWSIGRNKSFGTPIPLNDEQNGTDNKTLCTMFDSSWYYIRYCDANNENELCAKDKYKQVDLYCLGSELTCNHLIYARFISMFLYNIGVISSEEPFKSVIHNGKVLAEDGRKMSKSLNNVVNPNDYDPDELLFYLAFLSHFFDDSKWSDNNISGIKRFINRFKEWMSRSGEDTINYDKFQDTIYKYSEYFKFNKVCSEFMSLVNKERTKNLNTETKDKLISLLEVYMPGIKSKIREK